METLKEEDVLLGKYLNTDIDEYFIEFSSTEESKLVDEFETPENYKYVVMTATRENCTFPDWVTVANPEGLREVIMNDDQCLPDLRFEYKGKETTLIDFFKKEIFHIED